MKTKVISILFLFAAYLSVHAQQKIIGGSPVDITQRPYQAAVFVNGTFNGGGVIIADQWILTAAHVVKGYSASAITVSTGYTNLNNDTRRSTVSEVIIHADYNPTSIVNDIALIKLSSPLTFSSTRKSITISQAYNYSTGTTAVVSGWGRRIVGGNASLTQLYKANVTVQSCTQPKIAVYPSGNASYYGDSGGPLTISSSGADLLIGLVSHGGASPTLDPTYYTNVGYYYNWILTANPTPIVGTDLLQNTATYTISVPQTYTLDLSPNISLVSQSGNSVTVRAITKGRGYINVKVNNRIVGQKFFWVGEPIISGITSNSYMLKAETFGISASIIQTEWTIGGNIFSAHNDFISTPYTSGTYDVTVRARNACGWGPTFSTRVTFGSSYYSISLDGSARLVTVSPASDGTETPAFFTNSVNNTVSYTVINMLTGSQKASGTIPARGGTINLNSLPADIYLLRLDAGDGNAQTFKIKLN